MCRRFDSGSSHHSFVIGCPLLADRWRQAACFLFAFFIALVTKSPRINSTGPLGFTLVEVVIALTILSLTLSAIVAGYTYCSREAEWSAYSLLAQGEAEQRLAQVRLARWTTLTANPVDELVSTNFPAQVNSRDYNISGVTTFFVTNITTFTAISTNPPVKLARIDTIWSFIPRGASGRTYTNTLFIYRSPDE